MKYLIIALVFLFISCEKESPVWGRYTFYTHIGGSWDLLVDGENKGELTQAFLPPECDDFNFITVRLSGGIHTYDMKSNDGLAWGDPKEFYRKRRVRGDCSPFMITFGKWILLKLT